MSQGLATALVLGLSALGGLVVPWVAMRMIVPTLETSGALAVTNYRGRRVTACLGIVWLVWAACLVVTGGLADLSPASDQVATIAVELPLGLVLGALAFGLIDDVFGNREDRGFAGHAAALRQGRLTTGMLKAVGIGLLALGVVLPNLPQAGAWWGVGASLVLQVLAITLTANALNLMDLRPGRALKVYSLLAILAAAFAAITLEWVNGAELAIVSLGPVFAVWGFDLRERGMLGDAGANAAGALVGWLAVVLLYEWWWLAIYVAAMLALNVASERVSFSAVIEGNRVLRWLDGLGRLDEGPPERA